jgi:hypothetical protein
MIENIAEYGRESGYTLAHYKRALDKFISHFDPSLRPITEEMGANEMATFMLCQPSNYYCMFALLLSALLISLSYQ